MARLRHAWILQRLALGILVLWLASLLVFAATQVLPGDAAQAALGNTASPERLALIREEMGLNEPVLDQYVTWVTEAAQADFGRSLLSDLPVSEVIGRRAVNSFVLMALAALIALPLCILIGAFAALHRDGRGDKLLVGVSLVVNALPDFVIGLLLVVLFGTTVFTLFPAVAVFPPEDSPLAHLDLLVLPVATLVIAVLPYGIRLVRGTLIDVLESEYVRMARYKGLTERRILFRHALPNALVPLVQGTAIILTYFLGGVIIVEFLFGYPGLGSALTGAIRDRDIPMIQGATLILAACVVLFNLLADIVSVYLTPRLRTALSRR
jgi:peptide/nickel transport system permease protein